MSRRYLLPRISQNWYKTPSFEYFLLHLYSVSDLALMSLQEHTNLYSTTPPIPEKERPGHLKSSAYQLPRINRPPIDLVTDDEGDDTDDDLTLEDLQRKWGMRIA
jgi:hypothetical protein